MADKLFDNLIEVEQKKQAENQSFLRFIAILIAVFSLFLYARTQIFMLIDVVGDSMCPTLDSGDLLVARKNRTVKRGDIIVFTTENGAKNLIKRVIALEGDTVWSENGKVWISYTDAENNLKQYKIAEDYLMSQGITYVEKTTVKSGCVFVLGDNRAISNDSRNFGQIELDSVLGVVTNWSVMGKHSIFAKLFYLL